jgi:pimeloyl-ACP methyl ester carboxylesterase
MRRIRLAGTALLHRPGSGLPLILLHGIGSDAESWLPFIEALPRDADVLAWWAPGYGDSRPCAAPGDHAARLAAILDAAGIGRAALLGHSLGCLFAARFAALWPARVAALAFVSPALGYRVAPGAPLPAALQARLDDLAALGPQGFAERRAARLVHRPQALPGVRRAMAAVNLAGYAQAVRALGEGDLLADAARIGIPARVVAGLRDAVTPPDNARALHAALPPGSALHLIPDCGHALPQEAPAELAALLAETAHA